MNSRSATIYAILLISVIQFAIIFFILARFEFGLRDVMISALNAAAYSFIVSFAFCCPIQLLLLSGSRRKLFYVFSYMFGFIFLTVIMEIYTKIVLGWPLDKNNSLTWDETAIGIAFLSILVFPLSLISAYIFNILFRLFLSSARPTI
jgi:hypothetical protein